MPAYVYILASKRNGTLYTGSCSNPGERIYQHRIGKGSKFVWKYKVFTLVYLEVHDRTDDAIIREWRIKAWKRAWKLQLIESRNPDWRDLYDELNNWI
ncbi:GIY-YIG nuclease family protein [Hyphobacterium marinum]|uniref:GIY-YIG nuclease family protein n=1 Tax=Hyphobacterium marinum TaxID=3116574 RepID=A0ABU7LXW3_9PROT|nr:GIY-YIG nuclease family protein [Hyphobacterium sp. Y6023]MEE2566375.1 GIY-YIG nuclease family protein [Hyphobacterium sp. Y6023]